MSVATFGLKGQSPGAFYSSDGAGASGGGDSAGASSLPFAGVAEGVHWAPPPVSRGETIPPRMSG